jgi:hypothetical protein
MKEKLLFVTKGGESEVNGFLYVLELAKVLKAGIMILVVHEKTIAGSFSDAMAAAAFAEAGEHKTSKELMKQAEKEAEATASNLMDEFRKMSNGLPADIACRVVHGDPISAIKRTLKEIPSIEMVLLSPSISEKRKIIDVKKLIKHITKTVVTISRPAEAEG